MAVTYPLKWDQDGERFFETGVKKGMLYLASETDANNNVYAKGVVWNGLTAVTESPSGAEPTPLYADDIKYLNLISAEEFGFSIEAYMYPDEWAKCDGSYSNGAFSMGQQTRQTFGMSYVTTVGNDQDSEAGYKIHLIYGALAGVSERAYATINDSPEAITFSWECTTTPVDAPSSVSGAKKTSIITIDTTKLEFTDGENANLKALETVLYGAGSTPGRLPLPEEVYQLITTGTYTDPNAEA